MTDCQARIVLSSCASREEAARLARALVEERLVACATLLPGAESVYRWEGKIETATECLLVLKTLADKLPALEARLHALHSYQTPEFLVLPAGAASNAYLAWIAQNVERGTGEQGAAK